jgi:hypothetical protein
LRRPALIASMLPIEEIGLFPGRRRTLWSQLAERGA